MMDKFLNGQELTIEEIKKALHLFPLQSPKRTPKEPRGVLFFTLTSGIGRLATQSSFQTHLVAFPTYS